MIEQQIKKTSALGTAAFVVRGMIFLVAGALFATIVQAVVS